MTVRLGIIADDFTGALLVAGKLEAAGLHAPVFFDPSALLGTPYGDVLILASRTRVMPVAEARAAIESGADALESAGCTRLAYKACASFDSTEEGNIGLAADYLSDRAGGAPVLMSAGFPIYNVTVHQGYMFYRSRLVSESIKRLDPLTPMTDPDLVRFLSHQTRTPVALLPHSILVQGVETARQEWEKLVNSGARHVLADTSDDGDVEVSIRLATESPVIVVASDPLIIGFAMALTRKRAGHETQKPKLPDGPGAALVGSVGPVATEQFAQFSAIYPGLMLNPLDERGESAIIASALDWATPLIGPQPVGISTDTNPAAVERAQKALGVIGAARRAERLIAGVAAGLRDRGVRRMVVSGGETSGAVVAALGIRRVRALPDGPLGSGFCVAEKPVPMSLFLKSGKLGTPDILVRSLAALAP